MNNNLRNQNEEFGNFFQVNELGELVCDTKVNFKDINTDNLVADNEVVSNVVQTNVSVSGFVKATGEVYAYFSSPSQLSMTELNNNISSNSSLINTLSGDVSSNTNLINNLTLDVNQNTSDIGSALIEIYQVNQKVDNNITSISILQTKTQNQSSSGVNYTSFVGNITSNSLRSDTLELGNVTNGNMGSIAILDSNGNSSIEFQGDGDGKDIRIQCGGAISAKGYLTTPLTTTQINNLPNPSQGQIQYNDDFNKLVVYNGSSWTEMAGQGEVNTNTSNITTLQTTTSNQGSSISSLQSSLSTAQSDILTLQTDMSTAQTDINNLETDMSTAQTDITALQNKTQSLTDDGTTLSINSNIAVSGISYLNLINGNSLNVSGPSVFNGQVYFNGGSITSQSVINQYTSMSILQNPAGDIPALSIIQGGGTNDIFRVEDSDSTIRFSINQDCDINLNDKFNVDSSSGNTNISGSLTVGSTLSLNGTTSQYVRGDGSLSTYTATGTMASLNVQNNKTIYMSSSGNDSNSGYSEQNAVLTLQQACTNAGNSGFQVAIFPSTYNLSSNVTLNNLNCSYTSCNAESGGICNISSGSYSVTISNASSSLRFYGLAFSCPVVVSSSGSVYFERCRFNTSLSLSGTGYYSFINCDLQGSSSSTTTSVTGSGVKFIGSNCYVGLMTVNSATVVVAINNANNCLPITLQAGYLAIGGNTPIYSATLTSNAITATGASSIVVLDDVTLLTPSGTPARMSIGSGVTYSIRKLFYDKTNSTLSGTRSTQNLVTDGLDTQTLLLGGASISQSGNNSITLTTTGSTNVTLPNSGSLATTSQLTSYLPKGGGEITGSVYGTNLNINPLSGEVLCIDVISNGTVSADEININGTSALLLPNGDTSQRPTASNGMIRYNNETSSFEGYNGSWGSLGGSFNPTITSPLLYQMLWYNGTNWVNGIPIKPPTISINSSTPTISITSSYATSSPVWLNGTVNYHYQIASNNTFTTGLQETTTTANTWSPSGLSSGTYYARAQQYIVFDGVTLQQSVYCNTSSFSYVGDVLLAQLSDSASSYIAASSGQWVKITQTEFNNLSNNISGATRRGASQSSFDAVPYYTPINYVNTQDTVLNITGANPSFSGYVYAIGILSTSNIVTSDSFQILRSSSASSVNTNNNVGTQIYTNLWTNNTMQYYVQKTPQTNLSNEYLVWRFINGNASSHSSSIQGSWGQSGAGYTGYTTTINTGAQNSSLTLDGPYSSNREILYVGYSTTQKNWP